MIRFALPVLMWCAAAGMARGEVLSLVTASLPETRGNPFSYIGLPAGLVNQAAYEALVRIEASGAVAPELAESWTQETPHRWVFKLRPHVVFSNGEPFTAEAVTAAFKYIMGTPLPPDALSTQVLRDRVAKLTAVDALTVVVETKTPDPILPIHIISLRIPAPKAWAKGMGAFLDAPAGTGPYKIDAWTANAVTLSRNALSRQPGKLDGVKIIAIQDQTARSLALASKTADIAMDIPYDTADDLTARGVRLQPRASTMVMFFQFVTVGDTPLKDVRVRQALNYAVNKEVLIEAFLGGAVKPATQFTGDEAFGFNPDLKPYPYDPGKARALLAEAGFKDGLDVPVLYVGGNGADRSVYQQIAADLTKVGVKMSLREITLSTWMQHLFSGEWPVRAFVTGVQGFDPLLAFNTRSCSWVKPHHCDESIMPLVEAARAAEDAATLKQRISALLAYERDNPPGILLWRKASFDGLSDRVTGFNAAIDRVRFTDLDITR